PITILPFPLAQPPIRPDPVWVWPIPRDSLSTMHRTLSHLRRGFTLVELLLVITIISILVSITIPALGSSRETARRVKCLANMRGIGGGIAGYMNDSKELLPRVRPFHDPANGNTNDPSLLDVMVVYLSVPAPEREDPSNPNSYFNHVSDVFI